MTGRSPSPSVAHASRSIRLASSAFGLVPIVQATGIPSNAVDHRAEAGLARGDGELRQVRDPQPVRFLGMENAIDEVVRRLGQLALVRAVAPGPLEQGDEPVPRHQPHDPFGGHDDPGVSRFEPHPPVAVAAQAVPRTRRAPGRAAPRPCPACSSRPTDGSRCCAPDRPGRADAPRGCHVRH